MQWKKLSVVKNQFDPRLPWLGALAKPATSIAEYSPIDNSNNPVGDENAETLHGPYHSGGFTRGGGAGRYSPEQNERNKKKKHEERELAEAQKEMEELVNQTKNAMHLSRSMWATALGTDVDSNGKQIAVVDSAKDEIRDAVAELIRKLIGDIRNGAEYVGELPAKEAAGYLSLADGVLSGHSKLKKGSHITIPSKLTGGIEVWIK